MFWGYGAPLVDPMAAALVPYDRGLGARKPYPTDKASTLQELTKTSSEAALEFDKWKPERVNAFLKQAVKIGLLPDTADYFDAKGLYGRLVDDAVDKFAAGKKLSPMDIFHQLGADIRGLGGASGSGAGPTKYTSHATSSTVNKLDFDDAHAMVKDVYQQALGRELTKAEQGKATAAAQKYATSHPSKQSVTHHVDNVKHTDTATAVNSGGYTQRGLAENQLEKVQKSDEYGSYQAATTYWNAFMQAVGPTAPGVQG